MGLIDAAATGDSKATLEALRDVLAASIVEADPDKRSPLAARLVDVLAKLDALAPPAEKKGTAVDELKAKRAARGAKSSDSGRSPRQAK